MVDLAGYCLEYAEIAAPVNQRARLAENSTEEVENFLTNDLPSGELVSDSLKPDDSFD